MIDTMISAPATSRGTSERPESIDSCSNASDPVMRTRTALRVQVEMGSALANGLHRGSGGPGRVEVENGLGEDEATQIGRLRALPSRQVHPRKREEVSVPARVECSSHGQEDRGHARFGDGVCSGHLLYDGNDTTQRRIFFQGEPHRSVVPHSGPQVIQFFGGGIQKSVSVEEVTPARRVYEAEHVLSRGEILCQSALGLRRDLR